MSNIVVGSAQSLLKAYYVTDTIPVATLQEFKNLQGSFETCYVDLDFIKTTPLEELQPLVKALHQYCAQLVLY